MLRSMMQVYVKDSGKAVGLYQKAFGAELVSAYPNDRGGYCHAELNVYGQILAVAEAGDGPELPNGQLEYAASFRSGAERNPGNTMQFCLHFGKGGADRVRQGYEALKEGSLLLYPLGPVNYSPCMVDFVDQFGVRWCLFE